MRKITLGKTGITVNKNGFGALPIQRISEESAVYLLRKAYDNGIRFYDTARFYTDSEKKLGLAFEGMRGNIYLASKTIFTSSIIRPSVQSRETEADFMKPCWRRRHREKSAISELPITDWR